MLVAVDFVGAAQIATSQYYPVWIDRFRGQVIHKTMKVYGHSDTFDNYIIPTKIGYFVMPVEHITHEKMRGYEVSPDCNVESLRKMLLGEIGGMIVYEDVMFTKNLPISHDVIVRCDG